MSTKTIDRGAAPALRIRTKFTSIDELVTHFAPFVERESIFAVTSTTLPAGTRRRFQVLLADQTVVLDGVGEVMDGERVLAGRKGAWLRIEELAPPTRPTFAKMLAAKPGAARPPASKKPAAPRAAAPVKPVAEKLPGPPVVVPAAAAPVRPDSTAARRALPTPFRSPSRSPLPASPTPTPTPTPTPATAATPTPTPTPTSAAPPTPTPTPVAPTPIVEPAAPVPAPAPVTAPPPPLEIDDELALLTPRTRRARIAILCAAAILFIGILAAMFGGDDEPLLVDSEARAAAPEAASRTAEPEPPAPAAATETASAEPDAAALPADEPTAAEEPVPTAAAETAPTEPPRKRRTRVRPSKDNRGASSRTPATATKPAPPRAEPPPPTPTTRTPPPANVTKPRPVRLTLTSKPPGATFKVNGEMLRANETIVLTGTKVTVIATMRGYKRATRSIQVSKASSLVIPLERL